MSKKGSRVITLEKIDLNKLQGIVDSEEEVMERLEECVTNYGLAVAEAIKSGRGYSIDMKYTQTPHSVINNLFILLDEALGLSDE